MENPLRDAYNAMERLSTLPRALVFLRLLDRGMSVKEIAAANGLSRQRVYQLIAKARKASPKPSP